MAEITRRRTGEFLRELFSILMAAPEGLRASEALQQLAGRFTLTPFEAANYERWRTQQRTALASAGPETEAVPVDRQAVSSTWTMAKDGKAWMSPQRQREMAGASAARRGRSPHEQMTLQARMLAKLRSK